MFDVLNIKHGSIVEQLIAGIGCIAKIKYIGPFYKTLDRIIMCSSQEEKLPNRVEPFKKTCI